MFDSDDLSSNPTVTTTQHIEQLIDARMTRRLFLGGVAAGVGMVMVGCDVSGTTENRWSAFSFAEIERGIDDTDHVAPGYRADVLLRWGDHLFDEGAPEHDPYNQTEASQLERFGYNNDFIGFVPLEEMSGVVTRGLLCVNHEYTSTPLMFEGIAVGVPQSFTLNHCQVEMAATGGSIVEVFLAGDRWRPNQSSRFNRRITAHKTPMLMTGPVAGHQRLRTSIDPTGTRVAGTMNNCAGGITPWGTWLMAEENFNLYFRGELAENHPEARNHQRYGLSHPRFAWGLHVDRFNVEKEPNEPNRFGWIVEVDPRDPESMPKKRSALGRFKHEGAESVIAPNGRIPETCTHSLIEAIGGL